MADGYTRHSNADRDIQPVAIHSVDPATRSAAVITRIGTLITVDCSFSVGEITITPAIGEQWYVERFDGVWRLYGRIPFNDETLLTEAVEGQVSVGGKKGPLELHGSQVNVNADLVLGGTHYRSTDGKLEKQQDDGTWIPVIPSSGSYVLSTDIQDSTGIGRAVLTAADAAAIRALINAGSYTKPGSGIPRTDLSADVQASLAAADAGLTEIESEDILDSTTVGRELLTAADAAAARAALNIGTGVSTNSEDILDSTAIGRAVLTAPTQAAAREAIGAATTSADITDSTVIGRELLTAPNEAYARTVIGAYNKPPTGIPPSDLATGRVVATNNGTPDNLAIWRGTQAQYDAIGVKDPNTLYLVVM